MRLYRYDGIWAEGVFNNAFMNAWVASKFFGGTLSDDLSMYCMGGEL